MSEQKIDEQRVDTAFANIEKLRMSARNLTIAEAAALSERVRVEIILDKTMSRSRKRWYRAYSDYLDDVVDERMDEFEYEFAGVEFGLQCRLALSLVEHNIRRGLPGYRLAEYGR